MLYKVINKHAVFASFRWNLPHTDTYRHNHKSWHRMFIHVRLPINKTAGAKQLIILLSLGNLQKVHRKHEVTVQELGESL